VVTCMMTSLKLEMRTMGNSKVMRRRMNKYLS
jgi:hypothetical protein